MKPYATRYACRHCGDDKFVPERPLDPSPKIRTHCEVATRSCHTTRSATRLARDSGVNHR